MPVVLLLCLLSSGRYVIAQSVPETLLLSGAPPGNIAGQGMDGTKPKDELIAGGRVVRLTAVTTPTVTWYPAPGQSGNSAAMLVLPGGGYHVLAADLEGSEICAWLNRRGISALLLRYRVPSDEPHSEPLADAQMALVLLKNRAVEWKVDSSRVGVIGFSAGSHLAARLVNVPTALPLKAMMLIYPAYLQADPKSSSGNTAMGVPVSSTTPPTFLVQAQDDPVGVGNSIAEYAALTSAHVPAEMHLYARGGHGYGMRHTDLEVTHWDEPAALWLHANGFGVIAVGR